MEAITQEIERQRRYRQRIREQGKKEILLKLPVETVEALDRMRAEQGASCRGDVVAALVATRQQSRRTAPTE